MVVIAAGFLPLLVHELGGVTRGDPRDPGVCVRRRAEAGTGALDRIVSVGLRSITWPFTGLITDRLVVSSTSR